MRKLLMFSFLALLAVSFMSCEITRPLTVEQVPDTTDPETGLEYATAEDYARLAQDTAFKSTPMMLSGKVIICEYDIRAQELVQDTTYTITQGAPRLASPYEYTHVQRASTRFHVPGKAPQWSTFMHLLNFIEPERDGGTPKWIFGLVRVPNSCKVYKFQ